MAIRRVRSPPLAGPFTDADLTATEDDDGILLERRELPGLDGVDSYVVAAHPAFIALAAADGAFGPAPEVVLSGVNLGANLGRAILHSGTVGAALTGALHDARAGRLAGPRQPPKLGSASLVLRVVLPPLRAREHAQRPGRREWQYGCRQ